MKSDEEVIAENAIRMKVGDKELLIANPPKKSQLARPIVPNRAQRRQLERAHGERGSKAKRKRRDSPRSVTEGVEEQARREMMESQEKVIQAARNIRDATHGSFWLPGQK